MWFIIHYHLTHVAFVIHKRTVSIFARYNEIFKLISAMQLVFCNEMEYAHSNANLIDCRLYIVLMCNMTYIEHVQQCGIIYSKTTNDSRYWCTYKKIMSTKRITRRINCTIATHCSNQTILT